jgi:choline dehydrogenase-like flavoprotein
VPHSRVVGEIVERLRALGLHPSPLPLGLRENCILCNTCNSFPCKIHAKSDADVCGVRPATQAPNVTLWINATARRLVTDATGRRVESVEIERDGQTETVSAPIIIVSCGAVNSAALLLRSASPKHSNGLANSSGLVGKRYMAHLATMMQGFHPFRKNDTVFQKTVAINDFYLKGPDTRFPLGQIQSQGRTHGVMAQTVVPSVPLWAYDAWVARGVDWLAMTEDLPRLDNKVTIGRDGRIQLHYRPNNENAHQALVKETKRILRRLGFWIVMTHSHRARNTTHQCGTLVFGDDPAHSVLDTYCRTHDVDNLYVVDASFFPSSAAVNPGLTIVAQAIRVADHIRATRL